MEILRDFVDDEVYIEIILTQDECLSLLTNSFLEKQVDMFKRLCLITVRQKEEKKHATSKR